MGHYAPMLETNYNLVENSYLLLENGKHESTSHKGKRNDFSMTENSSQCFDLPTLGHGSHVTIAKLDTISLVLNSPAENYEDELITNILSHNAVLFSLYFTLSFLPIADPLWWEKPQ